MIMEDNGENLYIDFDENEPITRGELIQVLEETEAMMKEFRHVINTQAEVLGLHRYILDTFVPTPLLQKAAKEYHEARLKQIDVEAAVDESFESDSKKHN
jgi:hypothetical protein